VTKADQINAAIEDSARFEFRHDGGLWVVVEVNDYGLHCNLASSPEDPYTSQDFDWGGLRFSMQDLLDSQSSPTPEVLRRLGL
jgi:hypothetical protein